MVSFECDYNNGAHPKILEALIRTNTQTEPGYGADSFTAAAKEKIKAVIEDPDAEICFLVGGTQTNSTVIATMLQDYEGVLSATTGHVNCHEAGAIEYTGHKVIELPGKNGKLAAADAERYIVDFYNDGAHEHMVFPGMIYISHPTEYGTLYTKQELTELHQVCERYGIPLFLDGARLGYGLASRETDVTIQDIAKLADVFYIGGTKVGALCGEAIVFTHKNMPAHFENRIKKRGALLAKGRLNGVQFDTLFTDGLYFELGKRAIDMAEKLKQILTEAGLPFFMVSPTNQQFVIMENSRKAELEQKVGFEFWEKYDDTHTVVRFATSWATTDEDLEYLRSVL